MECKSYESGQYAFAAGGFNRYIVECKWGLRERYEESQLRFNRYIVECKFVIFYTFYTFLRFNRYIVECKCGYRAIIVQVGYDLIDT